MSRNLENVLKSAQEGTYTQNPYKVREMSRIVEFDEKPSGDENPGWGGWRQGSAQAASQVAGEARESPILGKTRGRQGSPHGSVGGSRIGVRGSRIGVLEGRESGF